MPTDDDKSGQPMPTGHSVSRRRLLGAAGIGTGVALLGIDPAAALGGTLESTTTVGVAAEPGAELPQTPDEALAALKKGNERYVNDEQEVKDYTHLGEEIASTQTPFAAILSCADSRVSPTLVFDLGHGNLFNARLAGNVSEPVANGSLDYAVEVLGVVIVVVLGHSDCGAVKAALEVVTKGATFPRSKFGQINAFVSRIVPAIRRLPESDRSPERAIEANAEAQAGLLAKRRPIFAERVKDGRLKVVAATYDIASGRVKFL
jgi:carbonic anhydrase